MEVLDHWFASHRTSPLIASSLFQFLHELREPSGAPLSSDDPRPHLPLRTGSDHWGYWRADFPGTGCPSNRRTLPKLAALVPSTHGRHSWLANSFWWVTLCGSIAIRFATSIRHSDDGVQNRELSQQVDAGIILQFELGKKDLPSAYHPYLRAGLHRVLARPLVSRREWLQLVSSKRTMTRREATPQRGIMQRFMASCRAVTPSPSTR